MNKALCNNRAKSLITLKKKVFLRKSFSCPMQGRYSGSRLDQCTFTLYGGNWRFTLNGLPPWY